MSVQHRDYRQAQFLVGVASPRYLPPDRGAEVAFAGRSNAGKSSAINVICGQHGLARVSKVPGRTQQINFFLVSDDRRLVDLPGYGYAKVPASVKQRWQRLVDSYLSHRRSLRGLILLMDSRHPFTSFDEKIIDWCGRAGLPVHILLTKSDKMSRGAAASILHQIQQKLHRIPESTGYLFSLQLFSAPKATGLVQVHDKLDDWLQ